MILEDHTKGVTVAVVAHRAKRPHHPKECPFCKGNEAMTPPTTLALPGKDWRVRCFRNAFPIVKGHEVVVETPKHGEQFENLSEEQVSLVFQAYRQRFKALSRKGKAFLFKNHGAKSGASIDHEHAQLIAFPKLPLIEREKKSGECVFCALLKEKAVVAENGFFKAVVPDYARFPREMWVLSRRHSSSLDALGDEEGTAFLRLLQECVRKTKKFSSDYTIAFHSARGLHLHAELYPRQVTWGGVELGSGVIVNPVEKKQALKDLR